MVAREAHLNVLLPSWISGYQVARQLDTYFSATIYTRTMEAKRATLEEMGFPSANAVAKHILQDKVGKIKVVGCLYTVCSEDQNELRLSFRRVGPLSPATLASQDRFDSSAKEMSYHLPCKMGSKINYPRSLKLHDAILTEQ